MKSRIVALCILTAGISLAKPAAAEERPWAAGVSQENQDRAVELFNDGTRLLKDSFFTRAEARYKEALSYWDHPAIHFNLAKALINTNEIVQAYHHFKEALKFGGAPLDADQIAQVKRSLEDLAANELAELTINVEEQGAVVTLGGKELFKGPGSWNGMVRPGAVVVLVTKTGFQPVREQLEVKAGETREIAFTMEELDGSVRYVRKFGQWIPWTFIGTGAALLGGGAVLTWQSSQAFSSYDRAVADCTAESALPIRNDLGNDTGGRIFRCEPTADIQGHRDRGELFRTLGIASFAAGGASLVTGFILLYVNREQPVEDDLAPALSLTPYATPDGAGLSARIGF